MPTISLAVARGRDIAGVRRRTVGRYTGPASYVTGGDPIAPGDVGMGRIEFFDFELASNGAGTFRLIQYDHASGKAIWVVPNTGAEVANGTNISAFTARFEALGA